MAELSTTEAARRLGVSSSTVAEWCRTGKLSAYKVSGKWRIPEEELTRIEAQLRRQASLAPMVAILGGRRGLYRMGSLLGDVNALARGPNAFLRRVVRKAVWRGTGRTLRRFLP